MFPSGATRSLGVRADRRRAGAPGVAACRGAGRLDASSRRRPPFTLGAPGERGARRVPAARPPRGARRPRRPAPCTWSPRRRPAPRARRGPHRARPHPDPDAARRRRRAAACRVDARDRRATRIGYIPGPGDEVAGQPARRRLRRDAARRRGAGRRGALARFDAVVVGVRAFNTNERLRAAHAALMAYVEAGGTLVVQYNTNNRLAPLTAPLGPGRSTIGQERVTDETAAVDVAAPDAPGADRAQPRSARATSRAGSRSAASTSPTAGTRTTRRRWRCTIPGEPPLQGGLLVGAPRQGRASSTPGSRSSGSCPPACRAPTACSRTCWPAGTPGK